MRKDTIWTATTGRDLNRRYLITEMPAAQGEKWAMRALSAIARTGVSLPPEFQMLGWEGIKTLGTSMVVRGLLTSPFAEVEPLVDEMMLCVRFIPEGGTKESAIPLHDEGHIEEVQTRLDLRNEVVALHVGFSLAEKLRSLVELLKRTPEPTSDTPSGPTPSAKSSRPRSRRSST